MTGDFVASLTRKLPNNAILDLYHTRQAHVLSKPISDNLPNLQGKTSRHKFQCQCSYTLLADQGKSIQRILAKHRTTLHI
jgi:hypothetical protein